MNNLVSLPAVSVSIDGSSLQRSDLLALESVRVQQVLGLPSQIELVFSNPPQPLLDAPPTLGSDLAVRVADADEPLFTGDLTALEIDYGPDNQQQLRIRGYDRLQRLRTRWSVRAHVESSILDLSRELVRGLGVDVDVPSSRLTWPRLVQTHQSDFEFLAEMAAQVGLYPYLHGDRLRLLPLAGDGSPALLRLGRDLFEAQFEANAASACRSVSVSGWNPLRSEPFNAEASDPRRGYDVSAGIDAFRGIDGGRLELTDVAAVNEDHLNDVARAHLEHRAAREVVFRGVADGSPALQPGARVRIENVSAQFEGVYTLSMATHTIDAERGFISSLSTSPPPLHRPEQRPRIVIGTVTQVDDPEHLGRVRVAFPTLADVESEWLQVLSVGAGADKGLMALPDVDDVVLVLFAHDLPGQGIVLGGLYGINGPSDSGVHDGRVSRYTLRTPGGQFVRLDDGAQTLLLETADGSRVNLSPDLVSVHSVADLDIAAPGRRVTIRGQTIDFERA